MATRRSIGRRAKLVENRVSTFLWGKQHLRDWKEDRDVSGPDADGDVWIGEVKSRKWPAGLASLWTMLTDAFEQAEGYGERAFAVVVPAGTEIHKAVVMVRMCGEPWALSLEQFRARFIWRQVPWR